MSADVSVDNPTKHAVSVPTPVARILADHRKYNRLLDLLDKEAVTAEAGSVPNLALMDQVMGYFRSYANIYHHPLENMMYEQIKTTHPDVSAAARDILADHQLISGRMDALRQLIAAADPLGPVDRVDFAAACRSFTERERQHMQREETYLLPAALSAMSADDWRAIEQACPEVDDPVFGEPAVTAMVHWQELLQALKLRGEAEAVI